MRLKDKVIIVTGSTTGIGKAIALACANEGARIVVHGLEPDRGREVLSTMPAGKAVLHIEDISLENAARNLVEVALEAFGKIDAVVNNAAWVVSSNIDSTDLAFFRNVMEVNVLSPFALIREALPALTRTRGCVLN
ncbi:MAG TPA: SDR family NAD(P)-dependent oxidoreductase, partial [Chryseosolibacter sp.]